MAPGQRRVGLSERFEHAALVLARDADAGVDHVDREQRPALPLGGEQLEAHRDPAVLGELDGVAGEVHEDLVQPRGIGVDRLGDRAAQAHLHAELLLERPRAEQRHDVGQDAQRRARHAVDRELARLDAREVEDVVDDREQMVTVPPHGQERRIRALGAARARRLVDQLVGEPEDRRQRRPDLVAHVRQELRLGAVGRQRGVARLVRRRTREVQGRPDRAVALTRRRPGQPGERAHPHRGEDAAVRRIRGERQRDEVDHRHLRRERERQRRPPRREARHEQRREQPERPQRILARQGLNAGEQQGGVDHRDENEQSGGVAPAPGVRSRSTPRPAPAP
jgi:hypothetical protein